MLVFTKKNYLNVSDRGIDSFSELQVINKIPGTKVTFYTDKGCPNLWKRGEFYTPFFELNTSWSSFETFYIRYWHVAHICLQAGQIQPAHTSIKSEGQASSGSTGSSVDSRGRGPTGDLRDMISMYLPGDASNPQAQARMAAMAQAGHYPSHTAASSIHQDSSHPGLGSSTVPLTHMWF